MLALIVDFVSDEVWKVLEECLVVDEVTVEAFVCVAGGVEC